MKIITVLFLAILSSSASAGDLYLNLGLGEEVISDNWKVSTPVATIEAEFREGNYSIAWEHQSLLGEGWPTNNRGEITIDEIQFQVDKHVFGNVWLGTSIGWEVLDSNVQAATGSLELFYQRENWMIGLQRKSLLNDQFFQSNDTSVIQLRISRRIHLWNWSNNRRF